MMVTVCFSGGKKITKDAENLIFFTGECARYANHLPEITEGKVTINIDNVLYMRLSKQEEIECANSRGWQ